MELFRTTPSEALPRRMNHVIRSTALHLGLDTEHLERMALIAHGYRMGHTNISLIGDRNLLCHHCQSFFAPPENVVALPDGGQKWNRENGETVIMPPAPDWMTPLHER